MHEEDRLAAEEIMRMRPDPVFQEHLKRMMTPLIPGFTTVCNTSFIIDEYEEEILVELDHPISPALLERMRADAILNIKSFEALITDTIEKIIVQFMKTPDMYGGETISWNATNAGYMEVAMAALLDSNLTIWKDFEFEDYKETLLDLSPEDEEDLCFYVNEAVEYAALHVPKELETAQDVYYDSASTEDES
jgi:hypothetical protein